MPISPAFKYLLLLLAGAIFPLSLAPLNYWPVGILSAAVLAAVLKADRGSGQFVSALVFLYGMFLSGASWVYISIHEHGFVAAPVAAIFTVLFCLLPATVCASPFWLMRLTRKLPSHILIFPALWVISEWLRAWVLTGFPWLYLGYGYTDTWLSGWAPVGGVFLLSFISAFAAALIAEIPRWRLAKYHYSTALLFLAGVILSGYSLQKIEWTTAKTNTLSVALVQPNIEQNLKWSPDQRRDILEQLVVQTEKLWSHDLIVWPEAAIPALPHQVPGYLTNLQQRAQMSKSTLITGIPTQNSATGRFHNSLLMMGQYHGQYDKTRLVPFGEYVPLEFLLRGAIQFFDLPMSSFKLGAENQEHLSINDDKIASAICYEVVYPDLVAAFAREATILLTVSNDAWFGDSLGPQQHLQMAQMRALENAKPMMRGTNNGVTAFIDHHGKIINQLPQFESAILTTQIVPRSGTTWFSQFGSKPIILFCLLILSLSVFQGSRSREGKT